MLTSINPLVERGRSSRYWITATAYVVGSVIGGSLAGLAAGALGELLYTAQPFDGAIAGWVLVALAATALGFEVSRARVPSVHRQVDERWLGEYRGWVYGAGFGFQLGLGVATIVTTASVYLVFAIAVLSGSMWLGLALGATFGLARALPLFAVAQVRDPAQLRVSLARITAWAPGVSRATAGVVAVVAVVAAVSLSAGGATWPS